MSTRLLCFFGFLALTQSLGHTAEWQFSISTVDGKGRAFLWIPPGCDHVRGVVLSGQVILEKNLMEDPAIRSAAARAGLALVLDMKSTIGIGSDLREGGDGRNRLQAILDGLAGVSGYSEIAQAPLLTIGHSGGAIFAWHAGYAMPERVFGVIGLKAAPIGPPEGIKPQFGDGGAVLNNIPVLVITGQYESWGNPVRTPEYHWRWVRGGLLDFRARGHNALMSALVEPGTGHFSWYSDLAKYVALFIEKAAGSRIPEKHPPPGVAPKLRDIPQQAGWLGDVTFFGQARHATAAFKDYTGDASMAFWHLDEELARANDAFGAKHKGKQLQQLTFFDGDKPLPPGWMMEVPFRPLEDGQSFRVKAGFLSETSTDFSKPAPRPLTHAAGPVTYRLIGGWSGGGRQTGPDTFRPAMDRFSWVRPSDGVMVMASHPGDQTHALYEQPAVVKHGARLKDGAPQTITFPPIADLKEGTSVKLAAQSSAGLPVDFFVIEGPAEIEGDTLRLTKVPPRAKRPVKVTVGAWNFGRAIDPRVQSAEPITQSFLIH
ncbi:MAG: hypothetical protein SFU85_00255 [Candidatus Methylacidiphilales bacterium]|nr:hypothetical protein [Candidatus Methylacidiphilales bacterium]